MPRSHPVSRRDFLRTTAAGLLALPLMQLPPLWGISLRVFTNDEAATVNAMCDRLVPPDEDPGAAWAGVVQFIDRKLAGYYRRYLPLYRAGLKGVHESSHALYQKDFVALTLGQQDALLHQMESNQAPGATWKTTPSSGFFNVLLDHTLQGFYGGPRHGGNREMISWRMLGLSTPPLRSQRPLEAVWAPKPSASPDPKP
ncbi:MAG: gluconate 2-dehydrogenase subunit 3 family protein [Verrucomicrobiota bacterium]